VTAEGLNHEIAEQESGHTNYMEVDVDSTKARSDIVVECVRRLLVFTAATAQPKFRTQGPNFGSFCCT
jgi:hypothetical protein